MHLRAYNGPEEVSSLLVQCTTGGAVVVVCLLTAAFCGVQFSLKWKQFGTKLMCRTRLSPEHRAYIMFCYRQSTGPTSCFVSPEHRAYTMFCRRFGYILSPWSER